ncbi:small hydrophobic protein [Streptomyces sp. NPDC060194]|uniref:small hydrophobic protein n=1 Tax=Streptomyces sp. NPDC060194 TaxID=3347069 RepID=UPI00365FB1E4
MASNTRTHGGTKTGVLGWISLVSGILGFVILGIVFGPVAIITGWLDMGKRVNTGNIPALIGFILGVIVTVLAVIALITGTALSLM